jgi:hypothetical protein
MSLVKTVNTNNKTILREKMLISYYSSFRSLLTNKYTDARRDKRTFCRVKTWSLRSIKYNVPLSGYGKKEKSAIYFPSLISWYKLTVDEK